jgi:thioredoxin 1
MIEQLTDRNFQSRIADTRQGVCVFVKKLCPHCKNMLKVVEKFSALQAGATLLSIDIEECAAAAAAFEAERAPTTLVIKEGRVVGKKAGLMNPKEMLGFYQAA